MDEREDDPNAADPRGLLHDGSSREGGGGDGALPESQQVVEQVEVEGAAGTKANAPSRPDSDNSADARANRRAGDDLVTMVISFRGALLLLLLVEGFIFRMAGGQ